MRFTVSAADLTLSARVTGTAVAAKPTQPVLAGVHVAAEPDHLQLSAFDFETSARSRCAAMIDEPGAVLIPHKLLTGVCALIRYGDMTVEADESGGPITVTAGRAQWRLPRMPIGDFPSIPPPGDVFATVEGAELAHAIDRVQLAAATPDNATGARLDCINIAVSENRLRLAGTDRYRFHVADVDADVTGAIGENLLLDARRLTAMSKHLGASRCTLRRSSALFAIGDHNGLLTNRLTEPENGRWVDYESFLTQTDRDPLVTVRVPRDELVTALRQVAGFGDLAHTGAHLATLTFTRDDGIQLQAGTDAEGSGATSVDDEHDGGGLRVVVNARYMIEALTALDSAIARILFKGPAKQIGLTADGEPTSVIVMPLRNDLAGWLDGDHG